MKHRFLWLIAGLLILQFVIVASVLADNPPFTPVNFTGFAGAGFAPSPAAGQLDSDKWRVTGMSDGNGTFGGTHTTGDFARGISAGNVITGGVYAFNVGSGNMILGVQPTDVDFTPGTITLKLENTTGAVISNLYVKYTIWTRNDQGRSNSLNFRYSLNDTTYTAVPSLNYSTPEAADASPTWVSTARSTTITGINIPVGGSVYLQWIGDDVSGSGSRDEYGIDDVEVRVNNENAVTLRTLTASAPAAPLITLVLPVFGLAAAGIAVYRRRSR